MLNVIKLKKCTERNPHQHEHKENQTWEWSNEKAGCQVWQMRSVWGLGWDPRSLYREGEAGQTSPGDMCPTPDPKVGGTAFWWQINGKRVECVHRIKAAAFMNLVSTSAVREGESRKENEAGRVRKTAPTRPTAVLVAGESWPKALNRKMTWPVLAFRKGTRENQVHWKERRRLWAGRRLGEYD